MTPKRLSHDSYLFILLSMVLMSCLFVCTMSHAELSSSDLTLSIDTHDHDYIRVDEIDTVINSKQFTVLKHGQGSQINGSPWLKIEWDDNKVTDEKFIINDFTSQAYEDYYLIKDNQVIASYSSGYTDPFGVRPINHFKFVADVREADYLLVSTCCNSGVPIYFRLLNEQELTEQYYEALIWYAVTYSIIVMMVIYNLIIYFYLGEKQYLMYCYYLMSVLIMLLSLSGIGKQFFWPNLTYAEDFYFILGINASIASMLFQLAFLDKKHLTDFNKTLMHHTIGLHLCILFFYFLASVIEDIPQVLNLLSQLTHLIGMVITDYVIIRNVMSGDKTARILLFGYLLLNIASVIFILHYNGYLSNMLWTDRVVEVALLCEALILSIALAQKIQLLREEKSLSEATQLQAQQLFSKQLLQVQEAEKKQLGNALHENFTHQLLILKNNIIKKLGNQAEESKQVEKVLNEIRDLSHVVHPYLLDKLGLKVAVNDMLDKTADSYDIDINFASDTVTLDEEQSIIVYRIIQESINNIVKYANATECLVAIKQNGQQVRIIIKDDGDCFENQNSNGLWLTAIEKRCQMLSGELITNSNENGSILRVVFPNTSL